MLIKQITSGNNYEKSLKVRRNISFALLIIGLVGEACYFLLVDGSDLPDFARGFYMGAASGICLGAVMLLVRTQYLLSHPDEQKKARIKEQDEREKEIKNTAFRLAGYITFFAACAALFVALPLNRPVFCALLSVIVLYAALFVILCAVLSRRL